MQGAGVLSAQQEPPHETRVIPQLEPDIYGIF